MAERSKRSARHKPRVYNASQRNEIAFAPNAREVIEMPHTTTDFRDKFRDIRYYGILDGDAGAYRVVIPDFPGCVGEGSTMEGAVDGATSALRVVTGVMWPTDEALPEPTDLDEIHASRAAAGKPRGIDYRITLHEEHE